MTKKQKESVLYSLVDNRLKLSSGEREQMIRYSNDLVRSGYKNNRVRREFPVDTKCGTCLRDIRSFILFHFKEELGGELKGVEFSGRYNGFWNEPIYVRIKKEGDGK